MPFSGPIDLVYTWVNSAHLGWSELRRKLAQDCGERTDTNIHGLSPARFRDFGELKYSLRSAMRHASFVRNIYVVYAGAPPAWLNRGDSRVVAIPQNDLVPNFQQSPTFISDVIESYLYRIPGLSEHYLYSNDDNFFVGDLTPADFFDDSGRPLVRMIPFPHTPHREGWQTYDHLVWNTLRALQRTRMQTPVHINSRFPGFARVRSRLRKEFPINLAEHAAQPFVKSEWERFHEQFSLEMEKLRACPFRHNGGIAANLLYHYAAFYRKVSVPRFGSTCETVFASTAKSVREQAFHRLRNSDEYGIEQFCLNDSEYVEDIADWTNDALALLNGLFPNAAPWEKEGLPLHGT